MGFAGRLVTLGCSLGLLATGTAMSAATAAPERDEKATNARSGAIAQSGMRLVRVGTFERPTAITAPPRDARRLFILEQDGRVRVVRSGRVLARPFIDISRYIASGGEQGLLDMAFDHGYRRNGLFYLYFTAPNGDVTVAAFRRTRSSVDRALPTGVVLFRIRHRRASNHNGGKLLFHGGFLYVFTGDGGASFGDPAQDPSSMLGKILRVRISSDGRRASPVRGPWGNAVYARGLRNPWRPTVYRGHFFIADVGESTVEEVNVVNVRRARGVNFGWNCFEGRRPFPSGQCTPPLPDHRPPQLERLHRDGYCSIIGGHVARDPRLPIHGHYLFGDLCDPGIEALNLRTGRTTTLPSPVRVVGTTTFGQDQVGRSYVGAFHGPVYAILPR